MNGPIIQETAGSALRETPHHASQSSRQITFRILFSGLFLSVILAAATITIIWTSHQAATAEWRERISGLADMIGAHAKQTVQSSDEILLAVVKNINSLNVSSVEELFNITANRDFYENLVDRIKGAPHIGVLAVIDKNGYVLSNSLIDTPPYPFSQWSNLKGEILDDKVDRVFSNLFQPIKSNQLVIGLGRKVFSKSGEFLGIVGIAIRSSYFSDFYDSLPITDGYGVTLLNQQGIQLAGSLPYRGVLGQKTLISEFDTELRGKDHAVIVTTNISSAFVEQQHQQLVAVRRIPDISMVATATVSSGVYLAQWRWNATFFAIGGGCVTLATLFLTFSARRLFQEVEIARAAAVAHAGAKTRFLSAMSHEIRTPLNAIMGSAELMLDRKIPPEVEKFAHTIQRSSKHLLFLINDILDFTRLEVGKRREEVAPFELSPVLDTIMDIAWSLPGANKLSIRLIVNDATPPFLIGDWGAMTQILLNLLSNAIKFTEKGQVELSVDYDRTSSQLLLKVSDTGWGITPAYQEIIFKPFERGRAADSIVEGTGLGLAIVKHLTDKIGGRIRLLTACGAGSTFIVELPMAATSSPPVRTVAERPPEVTHESQYLRILVAEDVATNRMVIEALLRKQGHSVHLSTSGLEALEAINKWHFDAVLMDVQMPEMDGIEATRIIRKMPGAAGKIRIIGLTAFVEPEQHALMLDAGMDVCLTKPLQTQDLVAVLTLKTGLFALKRRGVKEVEDLLISQRDLKKLFLADVRAGRNELVSCIDDEFNSVRVIHRLYGLFAMFDQPIIAQLAADAERSREVADARRLLHAVDDLLSTLCEDGD